MKKEKLHPAVRVYRQLRYQLADSGIPLITTQTPHEFLINGGELLTAHAKISAALITSTALYEKTLYSPALPGREEMNKLKNQLRISTFERFQLWAVHKRNQLTGKLFRKNTKGQVY